MSLIDQSHRYGRHQAACREPVGSYDKTTRTATCFEHKTQYLLICAPYTCIVVFWHIRNIPPMISQSQISCNTPTFYIAAIYIKIIYLYDGNPYYWKDGLYIEMGPWSWFNIKTLRPRQNDRHFADDTFKRIFLNENIWISVKISLRFVPKIWINNIPALVRIMAWHRPRDKPLSEPMMA